MTNVRAVPPLAAALACWAMGSISDAAEVRGTLQGIDSLQPAPPPETSGRRMSYWEEPNGAIDVRRAHATPESDLTVVLTGEGVAEMSRPVQVPVAGGRCRPGTVIVAPNGVVSVLNQDWFAHEFFATAVGEHDAIATFQPDSTAPRSERQVQIPQAGTYELHDRLSPLFRCTIVVGPGQGRVVAAAADASFHFPNVEPGTYTVRVYFEGRALSEQSVTVAASHDGVVPPINLAAAPPAAVPPSAGGTPPPQPAAGAAPPPADTHGHHHRGH